MGVDLVDLMTLDMEGVGLLVLCIRLGFSPL
jgi:hypothetical protein